MVKLFLVLADGLQELGVGGLTGEEFLHDLLNVREACLSANLLEGSLNLISPRHLLIHLRLQEGAPEFLRQEVFIHLQLVAILVVAGGLVPNLLLTVVALVSSLKGSFLVIERLQDRSKTILSLEVILIDQSHQLLQSVLGLQTSLLSLPILLGLVHVHLLFVLVTLTERVEVDLNSYQV